MSIHNICCVGVGLIGHSWATLFSLNNYSVTLCDLTDIILKEAIAKIQNNLDFMTSQGYIEESQATSALKQISVTTNLQKAVQNADYVQESVFENYAVKRKVLKSLDLAAPGHAIFASSSSGLLMSELQQVVTTPERCLIAHPWNPPHLLPLVELVPGKNTSSHSIERTYDLMSEIGKMPVIVNKEIPGHIANRLQAAVWREAIDLVDQGVCSVEDVDKALVAGPGLRWAFMGSNLTLHLGGGSGGLRYFIEHLGPAFSVWWKDMSTWEQIPTSGARKIVQGIAEVNHVRSKTPASLVQWRDTKLIQLLELLYPH
jgi:3-hydroxyacyl-CoA dehydrogenase